MSSLWDTIKAEGMAMLEQSVATPTAPAAPVDPFARPRLVPAAFDLVDNGDPQLVELLCKWQRGRPRVYLNNAHRQKSYRERLKAKVAKLPPLRFA